MVTIARPPRRLTAKEQLVEGLRGDGVDFISACEIANETIREFLESGKLQQRLHGRTFSVSLVRKGG